MPARKGLIVDVDGTIFRLTVREHVPRPLHRTADRLFHKVPELYLLTHAIHVRSGFPWLVPEEKVIESLRSLRAEGVRLALFTDQTAHSLQRLLERWKLEPFLKEFDVVHTRKGIYLKSASALEMILKDFRQHDIDRSGAALFDDTRWGVELAQKAGIRFLASTWGRLDAEDFQALGVPDKFILRLPDDLIRIVED